MKKKSTVKTVSRVKKSDKNVSAEIIFSVTSDEDGGFIARALGHSIFSQADDVAELHKNVRDAVKCHFEENEMPKVIRLHFTRDEVIAV